MPPLRAGTFCPEPLRGPCNGPLAHHGRFQSPPTLHDSQLLWARMGARWCLREPPALVSNALTWRVGWELLASWGAAMVGCLPGTVTEPSEVASGEQMTNTQLSKSLAFISRGERKDSSMVPEAGQGCGHLRGDTGHTALEQQCGQPCGAPSLSHRYPWSMGSILRSKSEPFCPRKARWGWHSGIAV